MKKLPFLLAFVLLDVASPYPIGPTRCSRGYRPHRYPEQTESLRRLVQQADSVDSVKVDRNR